MKFSRIVFYTAFAWGILILTPLYFLFDTIGRQDPPPITHPGFYYGFLSAGMAWQFAFLIIARDPIRFRPMMLPSILEKFAYAASFGVLYSQHRMHGSDLVFAGIDLVFGMLFVWSYLTSAPQPEFTRSSSL